MPERPSGNHTCGYGPDGMCDVCKAMYEAPTRAEKHKAIVEALDHAYGTGWRAMHHMYARVALDALDLLDAEREEAAR